MKICFLLQRRFAYVGHKIALIMKERYNINEFCGYVYTRSSFEFLKNQKDINYTSLLLDEEIHKEYKKEELDMDFLDKFEKEYGMPNIWPYITLDRVVMHNQLVREYPYNTPPYTHEEMMKIFQVKAKAILNFIETEKPDAFVVNVIGGTGSMLLYQIAKNKNIKILYITTARIDSKYTISNDYKKFSYAEDTFNQLMSGSYESSKKNEAKQYINNIRKNLTNYLYFSPDEANKNYRLKPLKWFAPKYLWRSLAWFMKLCYSYFKGGQDGYCDEKPLGYFIDRIKRKIRTLRGFKHLYDKVNFSENFAFFPLHREPEIALLLFAPFWSDQINLIKQVAKSLPIYYKLYVKEHPTMMGYRTHAYYKELKKIPNVKLIPHDTNSSKIIQHTKLSIVLSSTAGWETAILKKPVITFGDVFYNKLSFVKKCDVIEKLPFIVKEQLENFQYSEDELINFVSAVMEESASDVGLNEIWEKGVPDKQQEKQRLTKLTDLLAKKLNLKKIEI